MVIEPDEPSVLPVEPTVSIAKDASSPAEPASVAVTWENTADEPVAIGDRRAVVFAMARSEDDAALPLGADHR